MFAFILRMMQNIHVPKGCPLRNLRCQRRDRRDTDSLANADTEEVGMVKTKVPAGGEKVSRTYGGGLKKTIAFRMSLEDFAAYQEKFKASGLSQSAFFRECVLTNRTQVVARPKASVDKQRLLYLFNKASNNINQLAHRAHGDHIEGKTSEATYLSILAQLQMLVQIMKGSCDGVD